MKRFSLLILIVSIVFLSCVTPPVDKKISEEKYWIIPSLNEEVISYIGDSLLKEGTSTASDAIILQKDHGALGWTAYHPAGTYKLEGTAEKNLGSQEKPNKQICKIYQFPNKYTNGWGYVYPQIMETPDGKVYLVTNSGKDLLQNEDYIKKTVIDVNDYYFEQQLIYTGAEGKILKFSYREFADGTARPAFTVDATYDLSKDNIIRFKGAVLEIISYDNQSIKYKVLSGFKTN